MTAQAYLSLNPDHQFRFCRTSDRCSCGWRLFRVGKELAERSHVKHLKRLEEEAAHEAGQE